jgi:ornithine carbamoyltransferase
MSPDEVSPPIGDYNKRTFYESKRLSFHGGSFRRRDHDILAIAKRLKARRVPSRSLAGKSLGMIFQKPSTRTAVSFAVAMYEMGGLALTLSEQQLQLKRGETLADTARTLSRYLAGS